MPSFIPFTSMDFARNVSWSVAGLLLAIAVGAGATSKHGVRVEQAWARATPPAAPVGGAYLVVANDGDTDDRLLGLQSDVAERVEIHEMRMDGGVMRMRQVADGLPVPAHGRLVLAPGGQHLMLIGLKRPLAEGDTFRLTLRFARAGQVRANVVVRAPGAKTKSG